MRTVRAAGGARSQLDSGPGNWPAGASRNLTTGHSDEITAGRGQGRREGEVGEGVCYRQGWAAPRAAPSGRCRWGLQGRGRAMCTCYIRPGTIKTIRPIISFRVSLGHLRKSYMGAPALYWAISEDILDTLVKKYGRKIQWWPFFFRLNFTILPKQGPVILTPNALPTFTYRIGEIWIGNE